MSTHLWPEPLLPLMCDDPANDSRAQSQEHQNASYHSAHQQHGNVSENKGVATNEPKIKIHTYWKSFATLPTFNRILRKQKQVMVVSEHILSHRSGH